MKELSSGKFSLVYPLFDKIAHNRPIIYSILEGNNPGRVLVDSKVNPKTAFLASVTGYNFLAGDPTNLRFLQQLETWLDDEIDPENQFCLIFPTDAAWKATIDYIWSDLPGEWASRYEYEFPSEQKEVLDEWQGPNPDGYSIQRYDAVLAESTPGLMDVWTNTENFLKKGLGYAVLHQGLPVSRCHSVVVGDNRAEISIETEEAFRCKGLAQIVGRAFIQQCLRAGMRPQWSCWKYNQPSRALALKLGFRFVDEVPVRVIFLKKEVKDHDA